MTLRPPKKPYLPKFSLRPCSYDYYLIKSFFTIFLLISIVLTVFLMIGNILIDLQYYLENPKAHNKVGLILYAYIFKAPWLSQLILPFALLASCSYMFSNLVSHNEIIALLSAGVSIYRISRPLIITVTAFSVLYIFYVHIVVPESYRYYRYFTHTVIFEDPEYLEKTIRENFSINGMNGVRYNVGWFNKNEKMMKNLTITHSITVREKDREIQIIDTLIEAEYAKWDEKTQTWTFYNGIVRYFDKETKIIKQEYFSAMTFDFIKEKLEDFIESNYPPESFPTSMLKEKAGRMKSIGSLQGYYSYATTYHMRFSIPFAFIIAFFTSLGMLDIRSRKFTFLSSLIRAFLVYVAYFLVFILGIGLGISGRLPPFVSAWVGNFLFFLVAMYIFIFKIQT